MSEREYRLVKGCGFTQQPRSLQEQPSDTKRVYVETRFDDDRGWCSWKWCGKDSEAKEECDA